MTEHGVPVTVTALKAGERTEALISGLQRDLGMDLEEAGAGRWRVEIPDASSGEVAVEAVISTLESHDDGDDWEEHLEVHPSGDGEDD